MIGWHVSVFRQKDGGVASGTLDSERGTRLALWQTGLFGLDWLKELAKAGSAVDFSRRRLPDWFYSSCEIHNPTRHRQRTPRCQRNLGLRSRRDYRTWMGRAYCSQPCGSPRMPSPTSVYLWWHGTRAREIMQIVTSCFGC